MNDKSVASEVREAVLRSRDRFWRPEDFAGSAEAVAKALSRLAGEGKLQRVRRGLYWRGAPTRLGMAPPPPDRVVHELVDEPGVGPAGWSAGLWLGVSTQVPRRETIAVPRRAPRSPGNVRIVSRAASTKRRDERLRYPEVALLEVLRDWDTVVEVPDEVATERIGDLVVAGALRLDRVVRASKTEPPHVRERLRRLLTALGQPAHAAAVQPARSESARNDPVLVA
ncbi:MAG: hypothetical protein ACLGHX_13180 [Acidimicrobiia bacterium]